MKHDHKAVKHAKHTKIRPKKKHLKKEESLLNLKKRLVGKPSKLLVGWQEWCSLPKLHLPAIKAKIDTGAKTSALHAWDVHPIRRHGELYVHFTVHPLQRDNTVTIRCTAKVIDQRMVMSSGGHKQERYVIRTPVIVGNSLWEIDVTLTNRDAMAFRMLLGRDALKGHAIVDPHTSLHQGKYNQDDLKAMYRVS